jgi:hypothetical protein
MAETDGRSVEPDSQGRWTVLAKEGADCTYGGMANQLGIGSRASTIPCDIAALINITDAVRRQVLGGGNPYGGRPPVRREDTV